MADEQAPGATADEPAPEDQDAEEARRLKEAVARLGASLREESERLNQDPVADLPIAAAPRTRPDPRLDTLAEQVAALAELQTAAAAQAERRAEDEARRATEAARAIRRALLLASVAMVVAILGLIVAIAAAVS